MNGMTCLSQKYQVLIIYRDTCIVNRNKQVNDACNLYSTNFDIELVLVSVFFKDYDRTLI